MQQLPLSFKKPGYVYAQIQRSDKAAIYQQADDETGQVYGYEVMQIQIAKEAVVFGKQYPEREVMPSTAEWGSKAFTCWTLDRAKELFNQLNIVKP